MEQLRRAVQVTRNQNGRDLVQLLQSAELR